MPVVPARELTLRFEFIWGLVPPLAIVGAVAVEGTKCLSAMKSCQLRP